MTRRQQLSPAPAAMTSAFFVDGRSMRWMARHFKTRIAVIEYRVWLSYWERGEERRPSRKQRAAFRARLGV